MSNPTINTQEERDLEAVAMNIVHQIGDALYEALPKDIAHDHFVDARQKTNDVAIDFAKKLILAYKDNAVNNFKEILKMSDSYTFEDGTKFVRSSEGDK